MHASNMNEPITNNADSTKDESSTTPAAATAAATTNSSTTNNKSTATTTTTTTTMIQVEGGSLQDRLRLLEEQKQRDAAKLVSTTRTQPSQVTDDLIRERLQWIDNQQGNKQQQQQKASIVVEGGGLKDRLKLLEEQRQKELQKLEAARERGRTDPSLIDRVQWIERQQQRQEMFQKAAIVVEGGGVKDRKLLLEEQRERAKFVSTTTTTDLALVSDDLIRERLKWMDEISSSTMNNNKFDGCNKAAIIVEGGNLQERLELLHEQRRRQAERAASKQTELSQVSDDLIRERLQWIEKQLQQQQQAGGEDSNKEAIVIDGDTLQERKRLLEEERRRESDRLAVRRLVEVSSDTVQDRMKWLSEQQQAAKQDDTVHTLIMSSDLIAERINWLKQSAEKAAELPEKENIEITNNLVKQRKEWLDEQLKKAAELPPKQRVQVTHGLIAERISWLQIQMNQANKLSQNERTKMTTDLIAERIAYLEAQIQAHAADDAETKANLEMQIDFLEEQQQKLEQDMTEDEQLVMANVLITEKINDLEQQKELINEIPDDQQIEVTKVLLEDRQAWLEGDQEHYIRRREEQKRAQEEAQARALEEQETVARIAEEVARSVAFWISQKDAAVEMSVPERVQVTAFLMAEHIVSLEIQLEDPSIESETKESLEQQIMFLNDQLEHVDDIDHLMMIDLLIQEKVTNLEQMIEASGAFSVEMY